jgi:hypothetical protein
MHGGAHAAIVARATKASGVIVRVAPDEFLQLLARTDAPLVVVSQGGVFSKHFKYLMSYKGLAFFTKSNLQLSLPRGTDTVVAERIWIPE